MGAGSSCIEQMVNKAWRYWPICAIIVLASATLLRMPVTDAASTDADVFDTVVIL